MEPTNYFKEKKFCPACEAYVRYLMSPTASYCVACGGRVHLFSEEDRARFLSHLHPAKSRPGRGRKKVS